MTTIRHHLTDDILMAYSAGSLPEAFSLVTATHISLCDECRARLGAFDSLGGALLEKSDSSESVDFEATLSRIESELPVAAPLPATDLPEPLASYVGGGSDAIEWTRVGGGVKQSVLATSGKATVRLLHIPSGRAVPDHGHGGMEMTLVLKGAFRDEMDRFAAGDVEVANEDVQHQPIAEEGEDCLCLAATDERLRFSGWLPRLAQRFAGI